MSKKHFTRLDIQNILANNSLDAEVSYLERENPQSPDNFIIYLRLSPNKSVHADNKIHLRKALIEVVHFHKKKLDSIEELMLSHFNVEPIAYNIKQLDTDYWGTYYRFEILTGGDW